jgi:hypothetical protein
MDNLANKCPSARRIPEGPWPVDSKGMNLVGTTPVDHTNMAEAYEVFCPPPATNATEAAYQEERKAQHAKMLPVSRVPNPQSVQAFPDKVPVQDPVTH